LAAENNPEISPVSLIMGIAGLCKGGSRKFGDHRNKGPQAGNDAWEKTLLKWVSNVSTTI
jgi:hypothetical protein